MKHLLLISGGLDSGNYRPRYATDCAIAAQSLGPRGYQAEAYFADGSFPDPNVGSYMNVAGAAVRQNVMDALARAAERSRSGEPTVIYMTNHGGIVTHPVSYEARLYLWGQWITDREFFDALSGADTSKITLIFQQCEAGSFAFRHSQLGFEMAGAARYGPSYATYDERVDVFTALLFEALTGGKNLAQAVKYVRSRNDRPEEAWYLKPLLRKSFRL